MKTYIDILSLHKINKFHWHLTDDQGWRIEIKKYPLLTQIGSRRAETLVGRYDKNKEGVYDGKPYGGFYTQEEIREIVSYAAERHIEVIPEIEMPGHGLAALTAYPWLGCTGGPYAVWTHWGISDDVYCAGKETTFEFIEDVLTEVLALFPSKLIHIGGDECPKKRWKSCPLCQQRIREEGLKDEYQLQSYFIHRIERWMHAHGREIIDWDEILQGGISKTANIMSWNGSDPGIKAAQRGNPVIMTPKWYCYFDYSQTSDPERYEPLGNTRYVSVRQAYRLDPCDRLTLPDQKRIRGVQCNLWTEYIADIRHAQHMVLPRMVYISDATELGTIYTKAELAALYEVCREYALYLFLDGARLPAALVAQGNDLDITDFGKYCDAFYIGGTKNGLLFGEAVVITNDALKPHFRNMIKQRGGMFAKGFLFGVQFDAYFKDGLWLDMARHAVTQAQRIAKAAQEKGYTLYAQSPTNQVFVVLSHEKIAELEKNFAFEAFGHVDDDHEAMRFVCSWATKPEAVDALIESL